MDLGATNELTDAILGSTSEPTCDTKGLIAATHPKNTAGANKPTAATDHQRAHRRPHNPPPCIHEGPPPPPTSPPPPLERNADTNWRTAVTLTKNTVDVNEATAATAHRRAHHRPPLPPTAEVHSHEA